MIETFSLSFINCYKYQLDQKIKLTFLIELINMIELINLMVQTLLHQQLNPIYNTLKPTNQKR